MTLQPLFNIPKGSILHLDGRALLVTVREESGYAVECQESGECFTLSLERVEAAIRARDCEVIQPKDAEKRKALLDYTGGFECMEQLSEETQRIIRARLALVLAMDELRAEGVKLTQRNMSNCGAQRRALLVRADEIAPGHNFLRTRRGGKLAVGFTVPQGRTLARYHETYHRFEQNAVVLADRDHLKGRREPRLLPWQKRFIDYVLNTWMDKRKPSLAPLVNMAIGVFDRTPTEKAQGVGFPSITTIRAYAKAISGVTVALGRNGRRHTTNTKGAGSTDVRALRFGEKFEWDQVYLSIFTDGGGVMRARAIDPETASEELEDNEVRRCWMHAILDVATREVLGWVISETADADHSLALLRMATRDKTKEKVRYDCKHEPPPPIRLGLSLADNGTATRNGRVYAAQLGMDMTVMTGRAYHATDKPHVERLFGTMQGQVLNFLPGYTGSFPGELPGYDPKPSAELSHDALYGMISRYFIDEYPFQEHLGTGMFGATPRQKREEAIRRYGPIEAPSLRERFLALGAKVQASTTSEGVKAYNIPFSSPALQRFAGGKSKRVNVHLDPDDLRTVLITAEGHDEVIEAELRMTVFKDQTLQEAIEIMERATKDNPTLRELHRAHLEEARARRARESGFFKDSRDPSNYETLAQLQRRAEKLLQVETRPASYTGATVAPGSIMSRGVPVESAPVTPPEIDGSLGTQSSNSTVPPNRSHQAVETTTSPRRRPQKPTDDAVDIKSMKFPPITDSKL
ncbi:integrase catalytic domain-containing protein [Thalassovita mangrovi]|uniref:DDE-type integrase/transposase/recombinase n=1 Tax=Thalassovita mangrovi TaxID=2692236 RepID=A0A6L8LLX4_9RHOB|nr:DDE-type integrase/transposase/recombinase [Thalassovita mangrovi]MYM56613.1 DDE-type integrase/transposase/recombinase [Thalassovita mangrovi]